MGWKVAIVVLLCSCFGRAGHVGTTWVQGVYFDSSCTNLLAYVEGQIEGGPSDPSLAQQRTLTTEDGCTSVVMSSVAVAHIMVDCQNQVQNVYEASDTTCIGTVTDSGSLASATESLIPTYQTWDAGGCSEYSMEIDNVYLQLVDPVSLNAIVTEGSTDKYMCAGDGQLGSASLGEDPHLLGAHGDRADIRGVHKGVYAVLSSRNISLGVQFVHDNYTTPFSKMHVHGSWLRAAFWTLRTARSSRLLHIFFHATDPHRAVITEGEAREEATLGAEAVREGGGIDGANRYILLEGQPSFVAEDVRVSFVRPKTLEVSTHNWRTTAQSTIAVPHFGKLRMNVEVQPLHAGSRGGPHGLLGQT